MKLNITIDLEDFMSDWGRARRDDPEGNRDGGAQTSEEVTRI